MRLRYPILTLALPLTGREREEASFVRFDSVPRATTLSANGD